MDNEENKFNPEMWDVLPILILLLIFASPSNPTMQEIPQNIPERKGENHDRQN